LQVRQQQLRSELRGGLSGLPAPSNEYQVMLPEEDEGSTADGMDVDGLEEDAADVKARRKVRSYLLVTMYSCCAEVWCGLVLQHTDTKLKGHLQALGGLG
jgi:pre-mRNA splicing factor component